MSETTKKTTSAQDRMFEQFSEMMIEKVESISADWQKPWFTKGMATRPCNLNGREYTSVNMLMLWFHCGKQGYEYPVYATFNSIKALNGTKKAKGNEVCVNKGEKSFPVFFYTQVIVHKKSHEKITQEEYKRLGEAERKEYMVYPKMVVYNVFNIAQTNMREARPDLWAKYTRESDGHPTADGYTFAPLMSTIERQSWHCPINVRENGANAYYSISRDIIEVPSREQFPKGEQFVATCFHEMAHSTGKALQRFADFEGEEAYAREELIAELTSALTCAQFGMSSSVKDESAKYLRHWLGELRQSPEFIRTVLKEVRKANNVLREHIEGEMAESERQATKVA